MAMKNLLGGYTFIDLRNVETKTSHTIAGLYGEVKKKIAETDKPLMIHNFTYNSEKINDTMITNVEEGDASAIILTIGTSYKLTISANSSFVAEAFSAGGSGTSDYDDLENKPRINYVELDGNNNNTDLGILPDFVIDLSDEWAFDDTCTPGTNTWWISLDSAIYQAYLDVLERDQTAHYSYTYLIKGVPCPNNNYADARERLTFVASPGSYKLSSKTFYLTESSSLGTYQVQLKFDDTNEGVYIASRQLLAPLSSIPGPTAITLVDTDNTYFTITPAQPEASLEYAVYNTEYKFVQYSKTAGGISVQDAQAAVTWTGSSFSLLIPINPLNALTTYGGWNLVELPSDDVSYTNKKFWIRADYDVTNDWKIVIKMKEYT